MPIYEFKCLKCGEYREFLLKSSDESVDLECEQCGGAELERVLSTTRHVMGGSSTNSPAASPSVTNRNCGGGSCTTWNLPGPGD